MPKYTVHIYPIVRVTVPDVEAEDPVAAIKKAEAMVDMSHFFGQVHTSASRPGTPVLLPLEYADDVDGYLVDENQGAESGSSTWYNKDYRPRSPEGR